MISPVVEYLCRWPHGVKFEEWVMQQHMMASAKNHTLGVVETIHPEDQVCVGCSFKAPTDATEEEAVEWIKMHDRAHHQQTGVH
jgi:hypothetical protein